MSLINDALKRTEAEKNDNALPPDSEPDLSPVEYGRPRRFSPLGLLLIASIATASLAGWMMWKDVVASNAPRRVAAQALKPKRPAPSYPQAELAIAKTLEALQYYQPPARPAREQDKELETKQAAVSTAQGSPAGEADVTTSRQEGEPTTQPAEKTATAKQPTSARAPHKPRFLHGSFKLSAIILDHGGATAIINGRFVHVGSTINGAKVVKIGRHTVELKFNGRTITIQM